MKGVTKNQEEILTLVKKGSDCGGPVDLDQILDAATWKPSKQSLQFSIRACIEKGFIKKVGPILRRGRQRACFELQQAGKLILDPRPVVLPKPVYVPELSPEESSEVLKDIDEFIVET